MGENQEQMVKQYIEKMYAMHEEFSIVDFKELAADILSYTDKNINVSLRWHQKFLNCHAELFSTLCTSEHLKMAKAAAGEIDVNFLKRKAAGQQQELCYQFTEYVIL